MLTYAIRDITGKIAALPACRLEQAGRRLAKEVTCDMCSSSTQ